MAPRPTLSDILRVLNATRTRATYGAVADAIGCSPRQLGKRLGSRRPEVSWVVNAGTAMPTGYMPHELHRELQCNRYVIADSQELVGFVIGNSGGAASIEVDREDVPSIRNWQHFEKLIAEVYGRLGFRVVERGRAGADGGVDLEVQKDGRRTVVQCKYWSNEKVGVSIVRELFGVMHHEGADAAVVACSGRFTPEAERFARENRIELIDGPALRKLLRQTGVDVGKHLRIERKSRRLGRSWRVAAALGLMLIILGVAVLGPRYAGDWIVSNLTGNSRLDKSQPRAASMTVTTAKRDETEARALEKSARHPSVPAQDRIAKPTFNQLYQPPPECVASASNPKPDLVACANHRIRARREYQQETQ